MKRVLVTAAMLLCLCTSVMAQKEALYYYSIEDKSFAIRNWIDRSAMKFYFDSDSESDANMLIKNYKKTGNKESFDVYKEANPKEKVGHIVLNSNPDMEIKKDMDFSLQIAVETAFGRTVKFGFLTEAQQKKLDRLNGKRSHDESGDPRENVMNKAKDKAKGLLNKGKNLIKKKK